MAKLFKASNGWAKVVLGIAVVVLAVTATMSLAADPENALTEVTSATAPAAEEITSTTPADAVPAAEEATSTTPVTPDAVSALTETVSNLEGAIPAIAEAANSIAKTAPTLADAVSKLREVASAFEKAASELAKTASELTKVVSEMAPPLATMETIMKYNDLVNGIVWGPWMCAFIVGVGIYLSMTLGFPQFRYFGIAFKQVFGRNKSAQSEGSISSFAALSTALAATVGTGNIAGVATALHLGGPGALFWMLFSALFGMTTKFSEVALAVKFREKDADGNWRGGTMHVLEYGARQKWLAWIFAVFAFLASFGIGCAVQANSTAEGIKLGFDIPVLYTGIALAVLVAAVIIGGLKSLAKVTTLLVPAMAVFYIIGAGWVAVENADKIPEVIGNAVKYAFTDPMAMPGALAGWTMKLAVQKGIARGIFSNEAGLGSAPMVHATATVDHPVRQGLYGIFEVFADTIVICTLTALTIMLTGTLTSEPGLTGAQLSLAAFEAALGMTFGKVILPIALSLFAFTTILGWYWYSETAAVYIFGTWIKSVVKVLFVVITLIGACGGELFGGGNLFLAHLWDIADTLNGLMAIPNLIALVLLAGVLRALIKDFDDKRESGELKI